MVGKWETLIFWKWSQIWKGERWSRTPSDTIYEQVNPREPAAPSQPHFPQWHKRGRTVLLSRGCGGIEQEGTVPARGLCSVFVIALSGGLSCSRQRILNCKFFSISNGLKAIFLSPPMTAVLTLPTHNWSSFTNLNQTLSLPSSKPFQALGELASCCLQLCPSPPPPHLPPGRVCSPPGSWHGLAPFHPSCRGSLHTRCFDPCLCRSSPPQLFSVLAFCW